LGTTYDFELLTQAQVSGLALDDDVVITGSSGTPADVTVSYAGSHVTIAYNGHALTFGPTFLNDIQTIFPSTAANVFIGTPANDFIVGYANATGSPPGDAIYGGPGDDTISGLGNFDVISGGPGNDLFLFFSSAFRSEVVDFQRGDHLALKNGPVSDDEYGEAISPSPVLALTVALETLSSAGKTVVAVQSGPDVIVVTRADQGTLLITLRNIDLSVIDASSFVRFSGTVPFPAAPSSLPSLPLAVPLAGLTGATGTVIGNQDSFQLAPFTAPTIVSATDTTLSLHAADTSLRLTGSDFAYDYAQNILGAAGRVANLAFATDAQAGLTLNLTLQSTPASYFDHLIATGAVADALAVVFGGDDRLGGGKGADLIRGLGGADLIYGAGGADSLFGGAGNDVIYAGLPPGMTADAPAGATYLRGEAGDDYVVGAAGFDDINGNMGNDTLSGGDGGDWVVGGQDNDLQFGDAGNDIVWGNLGDDTLWGGAGSDQVRGGQGNDVLYGGDGDDFVSGDRGADTLVGGLGADVFHGSQDAGLDRVMDFSLAEGDRVMLDPGTTYTVSQVGDDTVLNMGGANQMVLVRVQMSTLTGNWIFLG
jgi:Ca2+-binding RTX toxin-like protein